MPPAPEVLLLTFATYPIRISVFTACKENVEVESRVIMMVSHPVPPHIQGVQVACAVTEEQQPAGELCDGSRAASQAQGQCLCCHPVCIDHCHAARAEHGHVGRALPTLPHAMEECCAGVHVPVTSN